MGNQTSVTVVGLAGAITTLLAWLIGYMFPDFSAAAPTGAEAAVVSVINAIITYLVPVKRSP